MTDEYFMGLAIEEARRGDAPYGAVLVKDNKVVAQDFNTVRRDHDVTAHAEMNVISLRYNSTCAIRRSAMSAIEALPGSASAGTHKAQGLQ